MYWDLVLRIKKQKKIFFELVCLETVIKNPKPKCICLSRLISEFGSLYVN